MVDRIVIVCIVVGVALIVMFIPRDAARRMSPEVSLVADQTLRFADAPTMLVRPREFSVAYVDGTNGIREVTIFTEQIAQQGTSLGAPPVSPVVQRSIRFVCNQQTLPNDIASCMNRAVRVYFEGDWSGADLCNANGEACHDLKTLLTPGRKP